MMKILHTVEFYYPSQGGMQEVVKQISERLVNLGHDVTIATTKLSGKCPNKVNGVKIKHFDISGNLVRGLSGEADKYKNYLKHSKCDIIANFAAQQWATDVMFLVLGRIRAKKILVPTGFSELFNPAYKQYFRNMKTWMKNYDMNIFLSHNYRDIRFAKTNRITKIKVIPNGASKDEFLEHPQIDIREKLGIPKDSFIVLSVGSHTGVKGHKEAIEIFNNARITNSTLLIIGNYMEGGCGKYCNAKQALFKLSTKRIFDKKKLLIKFLSRDETVSCFQEADVFLFPSNIECSPIVLFESMAAKTPYLTTDVGNSQELIRWSQGGLLLPTYKDELGYSHADINLSVKMLENIYSNHEKRNELARFGFSAWRRKFTWEKIAKQYEKLYLSLL